MFENIAKNSSIHTVKRETQTKFLPKQHMSTIITSGKEKQKKIRKEAMSMKLHQKISSFKFLSCVPHAVCFGKFPFVFAC